MEGCADRIGFIDCCLTGDNRKENVAYNKIFNTFELGLRSR